MTLTCHLSTALRDSDSSPSVHSSRVRRVRHAACLLLLSGLVCTACHSGDNAPVRSTRYGEVKGTAWNGGTHAWLGVPYARPPVGALRWKAPRDPEPWRGELDTDEFESECVQFGGMFLDLEAETFGEVMGSEDCLYLNLWRPRRVEGKLPVFLYVHGGLNVVGEAATSLYHGANLAASTNMVVVTVNYRLGPFGWFHHDALSTGDPLDDSGNYGLLDLVKALEWVRDNIESFGGDPSNVTVAGESAGAYNVISLLVSPMARGLFHRAVSMSSLGSLAATSLEEAHEKGQTALWKLLFDDAVAGGGRSRAETYLADEDDPWVADYLRSKSAAEILRTSVKLSSFGFNEIGVTTAAFGGSRFEDGTVIPSDVEGHFRRGAYNRVPYIIGSNADEMRIFGLGFGIVSSLDEAEVLDLILSYDPNAPGVTLDEVVPPASRPAYLAFGTLLGRAVFQGTGVDPVADLLRRHQDVYVYRFDWDEQPEPFDALIGASHMMGIPFFFGNFHTDETSLFRFAWSRENEVRRKALSRKIMAYLSAFVRTGDPNGGALALPEWSPWPERFPLDAGEPIARPGVLF